MSNITALSGVRVLETSGHAIRHARMPFMFKHISIRIQLSSVSLQTVSTRMFSTMMTRFTNVNQMINERHVLFNSLTSFTKVNKILQRMPDQPSTNRMFLCFAARYVVCLRLQLSNTS